MIKFSIIVPVYNVEKYLNDCLNSILNQRYSNYEVIIVCDKCSDISEKIVDQYVKNNKKFKKIYAENTGLAQARNLGLEKVTGDYILFLDGDDYFEPDLFKTLNLELKDEIDILRFQVQEISENKKVKYRENSFETLNGIEAFSKIIKYHYIENAWCYCYKTSFWKNHNFKYMIGCIAEDYGLTPLIISEAKTVKSISFIGYNYVQRNNSLMSNTDYNKKLKKMNDMFIQATFLKGKIKDNKENKKFYQFINNSLIYFSTTLEKKDYKKINKILRQTHCFDYIDADNFKRKIKKFIIKYNAWFFYHHLVR